MIESGIEKSVVQYAKRWALLCVKLDSVKGIPDRMLILPGGRVAFIEFKTPEGRLSPHQQAWRDRLQGFDQRYHVVRSSQEGREIIDGYLFS